MVLEMPIHLNNVYEMTKYSDSGIDNFAVLNELIDDDSFSAFFDKKLYIMRRRNKYTFCSLKVKN